MREGERRRFEPVRVIIIALDHERGETESCERCALARRSCERALPAPRKDAPGFEARWGAAAAACLWEWARAYLRSASPPSLALSNGWPSVVSRSHAHLAPRAASSSPLFWLAIRCTRLFGIAIQSPSAGANAFSQEFQCISWLVSAVVRRLQSAGWGHEENTPADWCLDLRRYVGSFCCALRLQSPHFGFAPTNAQNRTPRFSYNEMVHWVLSQRISGFSWSPSFECAESVMEKCVSIRLHGHFSSALLRSQESIKIWLARLWSVYWISGPSSAALGNFTSAASAKIMQHENVFVFGTVF